MSAKIVEHQADWPRTPVAADLAGLLALNAAHETELSPLDRVGLQRLVDVALYCGVVGRVGEPVGFLIVLDQAAAYESPNFLWFRNRLGAFAYIDRIVIDTAARRAGHARRLYSAAIAVARERRHTVLCCEINQTPPNPASDRFHARLGFEVMGQAALPQQAGQLVKTVQYLRLALDKYAERDEL